MSSDKLAHDGSGRNGLDFRGLQGDDIVQELQQADGLAIGGRRRQDAAQQRFRIVLQHGQFEQQGRIENGIGILLEREDVASLASAHAMPAEEGILGGDAPHAVVADYPAQQAVVRGGNIVVFVDIQRGEGRCINPENPALVHFGDHFRIQGMDALHDEDIPIAQVHAVARKGPLAGFEIEFGDLHFLARQQVVDLLVQEGKVHGVEEGTGYATLTDIIYYTWAGLTAREYKRFKGLKQENLRDNMTNEELVMNMLAELTTSNITKEEHPETMSEHASVAKRGGSVAKVAGKLSRSRPARKSSVL